ncbi:low molecular weight protein tyrosine phosphatase family protein [Motilimonas eburnea]|uniref:low molecular weight protein tyrosine phosphatase family protein n=1 Tax=Motilimonas eburnea TaxID=1737488 RepID=UPI001E3F81F4|nr:phosphotyrosine protein phosphatase [Motilimonas eburnea]MCE2570424.1 phosphotyrosine protein phosphatase [Motilimonas eburnea]
MKEHQVTHVLFICSRNQWRSPTGEQVWKNHPALAVKSAGISPNANTVVNAKMIQWADVIFVMEQKHQERLKASFNKLLIYKDIQVLDIPDDYQYMDDELISMIKQSVSHYLSLT